MAPKTHQAEEMQSLVVHSCTCKLTAAAFAEKALLGEGTQTPTYLVSKIIDSSCTLVQVITAAFHCCHSAFNLQGQVFLNTDSLCAKLGRHSCCHFR